MKIRQGNIIDLMLNAQYDVAIQGCNCMCKQKSGLAAQMVQHFSTNSPTYFKMESSAEGWCGNINKLGCIDYSRFYVDGARATHISPLNEGRRKEPIVTIVNCYTQIVPGIAGIHGIPLDYEALHLCLRKINSIFKDRSIAIPYLIGGGLAKGDHEKILSIIDHELVDVNVTLVKLP